MDEAITAKVRAVNRANEYAVQLYDQLRPIFEPLVGQRVLVADGTLSKKIKVQIPALPPAFTGDLCVAKGASVYSLLWLVKAEGRAGNAKQWHEVLLYVGEVDQRTLTSIRDRPRFRTDWTVEEVLAKRAAWEAALAAYENACVELGPFARVR